MREQSQGSVTNDVISLGVEVVEKDKQDDGGGELPRGKGCSGKSDIWKILLHNIK